jgi:hypothetical protein
MIWRLFVGRRLIMVVGNLVRQMMAAALVTIFVSNSVNRAEDQPGPKSDAEIGIDALTQFHLSMRNLCIHPSITVEYEGILGQPLRANGGVLNSAPKSQSRWSIVYKENKNALSLVIGRVSVSYRDSKEAEYEYKVGNHTLFLTVSAESLSTDKNGKLFSNSPFVELRDVTINQMIKKLEWTKK